MYFLQIRFWIRLLEIKKIHIKRILASIIIFELVFVHPHRFLDIDDAHRMLA